MEGVRIVKKKYMRLISALLLLSMCMGLLSGCISKDVSQNNPSGKTELDVAAIPEGNTVLNEFTDRTIHNEEDALAAIQEVSTATGITNVSSTLGDVQQFTSLDSTFYRFAQVYEGIPVYGRSVTVGASSEGSSQGLSHNYIQISDVDTTPTISMDTAKQIVVDMYGEDVQVTSCSLTIYSLFGYTPVLAWQVQIAGPAMLYTCFVDAHTGAFINSFSGIFTESEMGTYTDSNGTIDFYTVKNADGTYSLIDEDRNLEVYDANYQTVIRTIVDDQGNTYQYDSSADKWLDGNGSEVVISGMEDEKSFWLMYGSWDVLDAQGNVVGRNADYLPCAGNPLNALHILSNPTTAWSNQKAAAAMSLTEDIYDFYHSVLGRTGFNGNNGTVRISVNDDINGDSSNAYSAMGSTRAFTLLSFGHAGTITADLIGHEFNHSVEQSISSLVYQGESGAIMEALADVFGELSEDWIGDQQLDDDCDWIHGSRNMIDPATSTQQACYYEYNGQTCPVKAKDKEGKHRIGEGLKKPSWFSTGSCVLDIPYPKYYQGENYYLGSGDNGGVHTNHTVISHAAYLMTHPNDPTVDALTNEELAKVLYYALSYLPSDCNFEAFASYVCLSAEVLKFSESKQDSIVQAFKSVGVDANNVLLVSVSEDPLDYMVTETSEWNVFGRSGALCDNYILRISGKETLKNLYHTGPFEEADQTVTEHKVTTKDPLTLTLDPGYMYDFEFVDGTDPEVTYICKVGVHEDSLGLIDIIDLHTQFGPALDMGINYEMRTETIEFRLSDGTLYYSNTIEYPYFSGNSAIESTLNQRYADMISDCKTNDTDFDASYQETLEWGLDASALPFYDDTLSEVVYNDRCAFSIKETYLMWSGGAHPYHYESALNYDLTTGAELTYFDILDGTDEEIDSILRHYFEKSLRTPTDYEVSKLKEYTAYALCKDGLCFYYNVGDAVPRAEIIIPYTSDDTYVISVNKLL